MKELFIHSCVVTISQVHNLKSLGIHGDQNVKVTIIGNLEAEGYVSQQEAAKLIDGIPSNYYIKL